MYVPPYYLLPLFFCKITYKLFYEDRFELVFLRDGALYKNYISLLYTPIHTHTHLCIYTLPLLTQTHKHAPYIASSIPDVCLYVYHCMKLLIHLPNKQKQKENNMNLDLYIPKYREILPVFYIFLPHLFSFCSSNQSELSL